MAKFPIAEKALLSVKICKKCKARNSKNAVKCRKCNYPYLRVKRAKKKDVKSSGK